MAFAVIYVLGTLFLVIFAFVGSPTESGKLDEFCFVSTYRKQQLGQENYLSCVMLRQSVSFKNSLLWSTRGNLS